MELHTNIQQRFDQLRASGTLERSFIGWRARHAALDRFPSIEDMIAACSEGAAVDHDTRNAVLISLCAEARSSDPLASIVLLWLFAAGLADQTRDLVAVGCLTHDDLQSEALLGFWEAIRGVEPDTRYVARNLLRRARLGALRALFKEKTRAALIDAEPIDIDVLDATDAGDDASTRVARDIVEDAARGGVIGEAEAKLVLASPEVLASMVDAGEIPGGNVRRLRLRTFERLRQWVSPDIQ